MMPDWIKTNFTLNITQEDIDAANKLRLVNDTSYVCPTAKALRRLFPSCEGARASFGYAAVYYEEETHNFDCPPDQGVFERRWAAQEPVVPTRFTITLKNVKTKPGVATKTPKRYSKKPGPTAKMGI
jgi:hypothetical protein